jgi:hypothetical protein
MTCTKCGKKHQVLPDFLVPYKRHCAKNIEKAIDAKTIKTATNSQACEESTLRRFRSWFSGLKLFFQEAVVSLQMVFEDDGLPPEPSLSERCQTSGWLAWLVHKLVNKGRWPKTRSALSYSLG